MDIKRTFGQASMLKEMKVISEQDNGFPEKPPTEMVSQRLVYARVSLAFFLSERENLIRFHRTKMEDGSILLMAVAAQHPDYPITDSAVRVGFFMGSNIRVVDDYLHIHEIKNVDPRGYIPAGLFNTVISVKQREIVGLLAKNLLELQAEA